MRDLIVQWLTELTQPFWHSSLSIDRVCNCVTRNLPYGVLCAFIWWYLGLYQGIILLVTRPEGIFAK